MLLQCLQGKFQVIIPPGEDTDASGCAQLVGQVIGDGMGGYGRLGKSSSRFTAVICSSNKVNCLSPGFVDTDMNQGLRDDDKLLKDIENSVIVKRVSKPDEQAGAVVFFLSDYATCEYLSGSERVSADRQIRPVPSSASTVERQHGRSSSKA